MVDVGHLRAWATYLQTNEWGRLSRGSYAVRVPFLTAGNDLQRLGTPAVTEFLVHMPLLIRVKHRA